MKVDLERLRRGVTNARNGVRGRRLTAALTIDELAALLAVVDAARHAWCAPGPERTAALLAALEPFTPPADRAWEEVDRWHAEQAEQVDRQNAQEEREYPDGLRRVLAPDRQAARDQLADAGVVVQRQFRSDQERIAELEARVAALADALREVASFDAAGIWFMQDIVAVAERALADGVKP